MSAGSNALVMVIYLS